MAAAPPPPALDAAPTRRRRKPAGAKTIHSNALLHRANGRAPDYDILETLVGFWVRRAQVRVLQSFERHLGGLGVTPTEVAILILVGANRGLSQIAAAEALGTDQSTVVGLISKLERRHLVSRVRLPADRRIITLGLTAAGEALLREAKTLLGRHDRSLAERLTDAERRQLIELLRKFAPL